MGTYVGFATVGAFVAWYMCHSFLGLDLSGDGHSTVTWYQLTHWNQCSSWSNFHVRPLPCIHTGSPCACTPSKEGGGGGRDFKVRLPRQCSWNRGP